MVERKGEVKKNVAKHYNSYFLPAGAYVFRLPSRRVQDDQFPQVWVKASLRYNEGDHMAWVCQRQSGLPRTSRPSVVINSTLFTL